jgi:hypothetical protein
MVLATASAGGVSPTKPAILSQVAPLSISFRDRRFELGAEIRTRFFGF